MWRLWRMSQAYRCRPSDLVDVPDRHDAFMLDAAVMAVADDWDQVRAAAEGDGRGHVDVRVTGAWTDWIEGRGHGGETWQDRARRKSREARAAHAARHRRR